MLASTIQFTTNPPTPPPTTHNKGKQKSRPGNQGALPQNPDSMPPPHTHTSTHARAPTSPHPPHKQEAEASGRVSYTTHTTTNHPHPHHTSEKQEQQPAAASVRDTPSRPAQTTHGPDNNKQPKKKEEANRPTKPILRKEVIQPHLPVRLPCYDFVPITSPTFDRSP